MKIIEQLSKIWMGVDYPFIIHNGINLKFSEIASQNPIDLSLVNQGDVVAIIGDFNPSSILTLLRLIDLGVVVVPLTVETAPEHEYFFESALVDVIIKDDRIHDEIANLERRHQVFVGLKPRQRLVPGFGLHTHGDLARVHGVGRLDADLVHKAGLSRKDLRGLDEGLGLRFINLVHARMRQSHYVG